MLFLLAGALAVNVFFGATRFEISLRYACIQMPHDSRDLV